MEITDNMLRRAQIFLCISTPKDCSDEQQFKEEDIKQKIMLIVNHNDRLDLIDYVEGIKTYDSVHNCLTCYEFLRIINYNDNIKPLRDFIKTKCDKYNIPEELYKSVDEYIKKYY